MSFQQVAHLAPDAHVDAESIRQEVERLIPPSATDSKEIYDLIARTAAMRSVTHYNYSLFGGRVLAHPIRESAPAME